jgi:hypothetical protein
VLAAYSAGWLNDHHYRMIMATATLPTRQNSHAPPSARRLFKSVMVAAVLLTGGSPLAIAQNGPATGGEHPVAGGAAGGVYGWYGGAPVGCYGIRDDKHMSGDHPACGHDPLTHVRAALARAR